MISLLKDISNPINWIKLFKNPKKIKVLYIRLFSYPGMNFKNIKIRLLRNLYKKFLIKFLNFLGKKNKSLNYFFYEQDNKNMHQDISIDEITFQLDSNKNISEQTFDAFKNYGIIIIKDVISEEERKKIINIFDNFSINNEVVKLSNYQKTNDVNVKLFNSKIDQFRELFLINKKITKKILGKEITGWTSAHGHCGVFQHCTPADPIVYHYDGQTHAAVVFLTPDAPITTGTSFFRHKAQPWLDRALEIGKNGITSEEQLLETEQKYIGKVHDDFLDPTKWEEIDRVGNKFNRLAIWDAKLIHAASQYFGKDLDDSRLFHMFFFDVNN